VTHPTSLEHAPLTGLRVVEFGQRIAGPHVGTLLADFGARVIKGEAPPKGLREWGRHRHHDHSLRWSVMARVTRPVALNLRTDDCRQRALELCSTADVVVENFRPGTMEKRGLGPEQIASIAATAREARIGWVPGSSRCSG
jgi:formyl-CoA transferase